MKKIAIVLNSSWAAYNFRMNLARTLKANGFEVVFIAPYDEKYTNLIKLEFDFFTLNLDANGINPLVDFKTVLSLHKVYKLLKPDMILSFTIKANIYSSIVSGLMGIKSITNITGLGTIFIKQSFVTKVAKLLYKIALGFNDKVFFQNNDDRDLFIRHKLVKADKTDIVAGSGVDLSKFTPIWKKQDGVFKFLLIARLLKDKGILEYIDAIKIIKEKYTNVEFQILGELGSLNKTAITKDELDTWIEQKLINYLGTTDKVEEIIADANCVVLPSYREGMPRSLLEASAMSKPIITTNVVGCKEVVDDKISGYLCEVRNAKDLAEKMQMMLNLSDEQRISMGSFARKKIIREFDEKLVIAKYLEALKELI